MSPAVADRILRQIDGIQARQQSLWEAQGVEKVAKQFDALFKVGPKMNRTIRAGLKKETAKAEAILARETADKPELRAAIERDLAKGRRNGKIMALKTRRELQAVRKSGVATEEAVLEALERSFARCARALRALHEQEELTQSQLDTAEVLAPVAPTHWTRWIVGIVMTILGNILILQMNTAAVLFMATFVPGPLAFSLMAIFCAPITEELYKVITVRYTRSNLPGWVFAIGEMRDYISRSMGLLLGGIPGAIVLILYIIMRWHAVKMHMATTRMYLHDVQRQGFISAKTVGKGMLIHAAWNLTSGLLDIVLAFVNLLPIDLAAGYAFTKIGSSKAIRYVANLMRRTPIPEPVVLSAPTDPSRLPLTPAAAHAIG